MAAATLQNALALLLTVTLLGCGDDKGGETGLVGVDADGDGFVAGEDPGEDCDDGSDQVHPDAEEACDGVDNDCDGDIDDGLDRTSWYYDDDGDGYGEDAMAVSACGQPEGYVDQPGDCDDDDSRIHPSADESDCTDPTDYNCDGSVGYADEDGDRYPACLECDDSLATVYPGAVETCNEIDDDCDGDVDDDALDADEWFIDYDTDGYGSDRYTLISCEQPSGYVANDLDCNDQRDDAHPDTDEVCDGYDTDCDGEVDEDSAVDALTWYLDGDLDGYGIPDETHVSCEQPSGYAATDDDCDDDDETVNPGADERCNEVDDDCDDEVDEDSAVDASTWWADADGDGYGLEDFTTLSCTQPELYAAQPYDCYDDGTEFGATINPDGTEICDSYDNDCDGDTDESDAEDAVTWYADADDDGYGSPTGATSACAQPDGYVDNTEDCDDGDEAVNPGAEEVCNDDTDSDCDGEPDGCAMDVSDADTILYGETANSVTASAASAGGDVNGDGFADVVVGANRYDASDAADVGRVYVAYGPLSAGEHDIGTVDVVIEGDGTSGNDDRAGTSVGGGADLDGDGYDDVTIGAMRYAAARPTQRGAVYGLLGPLDGELDLGSDYDFRLLGETQYDRIGTGLMSDGDLNGDGAPDIAIGSNGYDAGGDSSGGVYVQLGPFASGDADLNVSSADVTLYGDASFDVIGADLAWLSDMDGDGVDELVVGNKEHDDDTIGADVGCVHIVNDPALGETAISDQATNLVGEAPEDAAGASVASAGDMNGDGYGDLLVGAPGNDEAGTDAGKGYLVYGPLTIAALSDASAHFLGASAGEAFGNAAGGGGDNDADGVPDLLFGAPAADGSKENSGGAYLFLGVPEDGTLSASDAYGRLYGDTLDSNLGTITLFVGDTDGTGNDDILLGATNDSRGGSSAGAVFLFDAIGF